MTTSLKESLEVAPCPVCHEHPYWHRDYEHVVCKTANCLLEGQEHSLDAWLTWPRSPWKPVDDRARDGLSTWLLLCEDGQVRQGCYGVSKDWFGWCCSDRLLDCQQVTYYMPLPKLPGGGK